MYIAMPEAVGDEITKLNNSLTAIVEQEGGTVARIDDMGVRRMAYEIKRKDKGYYVLFEIHGSGKEIAELERRMRVNDMIIRYLTVRVDEDRKAAEKVRARRTARLSKRAASRKTAVETREVESVPFSETEIA
jgi:small subunit ribosomal protein S6